MKRSSISVPESAKGRGSRHQTSGFAPNLPRLRARLMKRCDTFYRSASWEGLRRGRSIALDKKQARQWLVEPLV